jgi:hypothetical protein
MVNLTPYEVNLESIWQSECGVNTSLTPRIHGQKTTGIVQYPFSATDPGRPVFKAP